MEVKQTNEDHNNIKLTFNEVGNTERITNLENEIKNLNAKMDTILDLLRGK